MADDVKKGLDLCKQCSKMTGDVLKSMLSDFLDGKGTKKGRVSQRELEKSASGGKLESVEISDENIKDFSETARKYDITYALKKDSGQNPPVYHVEFKFSDADKMNKAFAEYSGKVKENYKDISLHKELLRDARQIQRPSRSPVHG